jgi:hypothetical protein
MAQEPLTFEEAGLAEHFLMEAFNALLATGDAEKLGVTENLTGKTPPQMAIYAWSESNHALAKRMEYARAGVLWTALGVEAAANYYIAAMLPGDQKALEAMTTVNKLLIAPRLAAGEALFRNGEEPIGQLNTLFTLRNRIVHPKVGKSRIVGETAMADFTPRAAADCLIAAAHALSILTKALPDNVESRPNDVDVILKHKSGLRKLSRDWTDRLPMPRPKPKPRYRLKKSPPEAAGD